MYHYRAEATGGMGIWNPDGVRVGWIGNEVLALKVCDALNKPLRTPLHRWYGLHVEQIA